LDSALAQTYPVDIVAIDEGAANLAILKSYEGKHPERFTIVHRGDKSALNAALDFTCTRPTPRHPYVAFLKPGDLWEPTFVEQCVKTLEEDKYHGKLSQHAGAAYKGYQGVTCDKLLLRPLNPSLVVMSAHVAGKRCEGGTPNIHDLLLQIRESGPFLWIGNDKSKRRESLPELRVGLRVNYRAARRDRHMYRYHSFALRAMAIYSKMILRTISGH
jgi:hypothetical protein